MPKQQLTETHRNERMASTIDFLTQHEQEGNAMLEHIVTGDETCVHHYTPPWRNGQWSRKVVMSQSQKNLKLWNQPKKWCVIHEEYFEPTKTDKTTTAAHYCDTLMSLHMVIKRKQPGLLSHSVIFFHDNARPHSTTIMRLFLEDFKWDVFRHSPYSPDLVPSDYHLFLQLKVALGGLRFQSNAEVIAWGRKFFQN